MNNKYTFSLFILHFFFQHLQAQQRNPIFSYRNADSLDKHRCWVLGTGTGVVGSASMYWLYSGWYAQSTRAKFHFFDDSKEWMQMDKVGHIVSTYYESRWAAAAYRWAGVKPRKSDWIGIGYGMAVQTSLEIADGFSDKWGFSLSDYAANIVGGGLFIGQQLAWDEQRISLKVSSTPKKYPTTLIHSIDGKYSMPLRDRAHDLLGNNYALSFLKDYNEQTSWLSFNIASFLPKETRFPKWLNVAVGYSLENAFVGDNSYVFTQSKAINNIPIGTEFIIDKSLYPRYRQFLFSLDIDTTKIKTRSRFLNFFLHTFNVIKIPSPTLEFNTQGKLKGHLFYF